MSEGVYCVIEHISRDAKRHSTHQELHACLETVVQRSGSVDRGGQGTGSCLHSPLVLKKFTEKCSYLFVSGRVDTTLLQSQFLLDVARNV